MIFLLRRYHVRCTFIYMNTMNADVFWRTWNKVQARSKVRCVRVEVPVTATLEEIIAAAGAPSGGHTYAGVFEVQTDLGVFSRPDDASFNKGAPDFEPWPADEAVAASAEVCA